MRPSSLHRKRRRSSAFTLVEMMVAVAVSTIILIAFIGVMISMSQTMKAISNYNDLDSKSRNTLDVMSRDIRNAAQLVAFTADATGTNYTSITFTNPSAFGPSGFSYTYANSNLTRVYCYADGSSSTEVMLTNCDYLVFTLYDRVPQSGEQFAFVSASDAPTLTKLVSVSWRCSRTVVGSKINTESVQTAEIATRN